jgi:hypothetical protein
MEDMYKRQALVSVSYDDFARFLRQQPYRLWEVQSQYLATDLPGGPVTVDELMEAIIRNGDDTESVYVFNTASESGDPFEGADYSDWSATLKGSEKCLCFKAMPTLGKGVDIPLSVSPIIHGAKRQVRPHLERLLASGHRNTFPDALAVRSLTIISPGFADCCSRAATFTASPVIRKSPLDESLVATTSPVLTPIRNSKCFPSRKSSVTPWRNARVAASARSASSP